MKVDSGLLGISDLSKVGAAARELEAQGFDALVTAEVDSDPFLPLVLAAEHTQRIELMTSIAVAFARNPMTVAQIGNDLQAFSKGRFLLGLGSQIKPHITKRFGMPWSQPAARMREFVLALRAIWDCWYKDSKLEFRGDYYTHTLMTPMFTPKNNPYGPPRVVLAAVGPKMTEVVGEVADGMLVHAFTTARYLREVSLPALARGLDRAGRVRSDVELCYPAFIVTGRDEKEWQAMRVATARQIGFYGSTPAYRGTLDCHGWGDLHLELNRLSKQNRWDDMTGLVGDDVLEAIAVVAPRNEIASKLEARFAGIADGVSLTHNRSPDPAHWADVVRDLRATRR